MGNNDCRCRQTLTKGLFASENTLHLAGYITKIDRTGAEILIAELLELFGLNFSGVHDRLSSSQFVRADELFGLLLEGRVGQEHTVGGKDLSFIKTIGLRKYYLMMRDSCISLLDGLSETS